MYINYTPFFFSSSACSSRQILIFSGSALRLSICFTWLYGSAVASVMPWTQAASEVEQLNWHSHHAESQKRVPVLTVDYDPLATRALHGPNISSPAWPSPKKGNEPGRAGSRTRPGPLRCRKLQARPSPVNEKHSPILFLGLLLTQTITQFCNLHVEYN